MCCRCHKCYKCKKHQSKQRNDLGKIEIIVENTGEINVYADESILDDVVDILQISLKEILLTQFPDEYREDDLGFVLFM